MNKIQFRRRHVWLVLIGLVSIFLDFWNLSKDGYGNTYYAAAVKSMLQSFHNFFFLSFDPGGFITIDKPPVGFWIQTLSAWIFGFHGWSILAPEALSGVISVLLIYHLVAKRHGYIPGLISAFLLAITPLSVATNRNNTIDSILTTACLVAAFALLKAAEGRHRLAWLLTAAGVLGIGFNIKFAEAFLVLPALIAGYVFVKGIRVRTKIVHLFLAACVLTVVSFSWSVIVDAVPAQDRPWVGSTQTNSEVNLAFGYDGIERVTGNLMGAHGGSGARTAGHATQTDSAKGQRAYLGNNSGSSQNGFQYHGQTNRPAGQGGFGQGQGKGYQQGQSQSFANMSRGSWTGGGNDGLLRLFTGSVADQIGWWLPLGIAGFFLVLFTYLRRKADEAKDWPSVAMWSVWFATTVLYFTFVAALHTYYMVTMAPAIAAMIGIGFGEVRHYLHHKWRVALGVVVVVLGMAAYQLHLVWSYSTLRGTLALWVGIGAVLALVALMLTFVTNRKRLFNRVMVGASLFSVAVIPAYWSYSTLTYAGNGSDPTAGPNVSRSAGSHNFPGNFAGFGQTGANVNEKLLSLLKSHYQGGYLLVTQNATTAAPYILATGLPVMAMGGFRGTDPAITASKLQSLAEAGKVKYFLVSGGRTSASGANRAASDKYSSAFGGSGNGAGFGNFADWADADFSGFRGGNAAGGYAAMGGFGGFGASSTQSQNLSWIEKNCKLVPTSEWEDSTTAKTSGDSLGGFGGFGGFGGGTQLYEYVGKTATK
ncbi:glycosyltransferase family 39 protein [Alicyclobacillus fastidiosus]|uniref:Glycosyltransferase family 39 protein n=1 Tax=Alicyclobacillus fastidiosus TaxID=392011 RepID=A0ABY6ZFY9_9BACL|nr:glycosyltransferase family 39 protein [Alicyclobacillus fastidiosus]WAH41777.1 glycosyltransferase family 39 protein [Alicyclobacillus fastidiosus]GMA63471.1 putative mannosyltransferase YkcB [Alicyclobacillus fastidiosus]